MPRFLETARTLVPTLILCAMAMTIGCTQNPEQADQTNATEQTGTIQVVTTTGMIGDLVRTIGGSDVKVHNLIGEGVDPHLYKPTRDDVAALLEADIVFYNGLHLEGRMGDVLSRAGEDRPTIAVAETIPGDELLNPDDADGHPDPHVWLSPTLWARCAGPVVTGLTELRPEQGSSFESNYQALLAKAAELDAFGRSAIASIPEESRLLITSHDAFSYFGRAFDLEVLAIQGITTESEAGLADLEALVNTVVQRKIPAVFVESSVPRRSIEALIEGAAAQGHTVVIGGELFSDSMGPEGTPEGTWTGMMEHDIRTVTTGLGGRMTGTASTPETTQ